ncbi:MAG TPA: roadblock/LC7 domain-containing protein [Nitrospiria bacterium]
MGLGELLQEMGRELKDFRGAALAGMDGIVVEQHNTERELDLHSLAAEFSGMFKAAEKATEPIHAGAMTELVAAAENSIVMVRRVTMEYFLILVIRPEGNLGKGRFILRRIGAQVKIEL